MCARRAKPARMVRTVRPGISAAVSHHLSVHATAGSCLHKWTMLNMDTRLSREHITQLYNLTVCSTEAQNGTPYDCSQADIDAFHTFARTVRSTKFLPAEESIQMLTSFLTQQNSTADICDALARLRLAAWDPNWGPDVIIKALCDIDIAFFNSRLRGHVKVYWCNSSNEHIRRRLPQVPRGLMSPGEREGQCTVFLNADTIFAKRNPCKQMWRTTLHELVHAYLCVTSSWKLNNDVTLHDDYRSFRKHHGWDFCWLLTHVHQRAKEFLNIRLLTGHDQDRISVREEWKLIYKDAIRLDRLRLDRRITDIGGDLHTFLADVIRFRSRSAYYEGLPCLPLGSSQPGGVVRREDKRGSVLVAALLMFRAIPIPFLTIRHATKIRSVPHGWEKVISWLSQI